MSPLPWQTVLLRHIHSQSFHQRRHRTWHVAQHSTETSRSGPQRNVAMTPLTPLPRKGPSTPSAIHPRPVDPGSKECGYDATHPASRGKGTFDFSVIHTIGQLIEVNWNVALRLPTPHRLTLSSGPSHMLFTQFLWADSSSSQECSHDSDSTLQIESSPSCWLLTSTLG